MCIVAALAWHWKMLWPYTISPGHDFDAIHLYLPLARELLAHGMAFFADEKSIQAPPFSYVYPALVGPDLNSLRVVNAALSGVTLVLVARTAQLAHSGKAGAIAAILFAVSPLLRPFLATPITEPPYLLLCAIWVWSFFEWICSNARGFLYASAFAIVLAALTRATVFYGIVLLCCIFAYQAWRGAPGVRHQARSALRAYAAALLLPLAFIVKNAIIFAFPFYATGGGNALYLGNNPLTGGYDAPLVGLLFDVGSIARDQSHLTLEAERLLGGVARFMIHDLDADFLLSLHAKKLAAFLFVTSAEPAAATLRAWRIALMVLAAFGFAAIEHRAMRWTLLGMLLYQVGIHIPVLYTHRYSVGAIDLWLIILSAAGVASLLSKGKVRSAGLALVLVVAGIQLGRWVYKITDPPQPNVFSAARILMWDAPPMDYVAAPDAAPLDVAISSRSIPFDKSMNYVLVVDLGTRDADIDSSCSPLHIAFRPSGEDQFSPPFERKVHDRQGQHIEIGRQRLHLYSEGTLRLAMRCSARTPVHLARMAVYAPVGSIDFRERYLHEKPLFPMMER